MFLRGLLFTILVTLAHTLPSYAQVVDLSNASKKLLRLQDNAKLQVQNNNHDSAMRLLYSAVETEPNFINAWYGIAQIYDNYKDDCKNAIEAYQKVIDLDPSFNSLAYLKIAVCHFESNNFTPAKEFARKYLAKTKSTRNLRQAKQLLKNCEFAEKAVANPVPYNPINAGRGINTVNAEYFPALTADEKYLYFTYLSEANNFQEDIYVGQRKEDGTWSTARPLPGNINSPATNEGAHTISPSGQYLIYTACHSPKGLGSCDLFIAKKDGNGWTKPQNMGRGINTTAWESQPSISYDSKSLYFIREAPGVKGGKNIYVSELKDGKFQPAKMLSSVINTEGREERPFIHPDNKTLYFASDGHQGMGGHDIFKTVKQADGTWSKPMNLGYPINSAKDELGMFVTTDGQTAFIASEREGGYGNFDIYEFDLYPEAQPKPTTYVRGTVVDAISKKPIKANVKLMDVNTDKVVLSLTSNKVTGEFLACLPAGTEYAFNVNKEGYLFFSDNFQLADSNSIDQPFEYTIELKSVAKGQTVVLNNVFFNTNEFELLPKSKAELKEVAQLLSDNPTLKIEIGGHTDNVGDEADNQLLSENRAKSVREFLIAEGIARDRLYFKGYGEAKPITTNDTAEGRAKNRRTEFTVL